MTKRVISASEILVDADQIRASKIPRLTVVLSPTDGNDLTTKDYVDSGIGGVTYDQTLNTTDPVSFLSVASSSTIQATTDITAVGKLVTNTIEGNTIPNILTVGDISFNGALVDGYDISALGADSHTHDQLLNTTSSPSFVAVSTDTISEKTLDNGVFIDGAQIKDADVFGRWADFRNVDGGVKSNKVEGGLSLVLTTPALGANEVTISDGTVVADVSVQTDSIVPTIGPIVVDGVTITDLPQESTATVASSTVTQNAVTLHNMAISFRKIGSLVHAYFSSTFTGTSPLPGASATLLLNGDVPVGFRPAITSLTGLNCVPMYQNATPIHGTVKWNSSTNRFYFSSFSGGGLSDTVNNGLWPFSITYTAV